MGERAKVSKSHTLAGEKKIRAGAWREKGNLHSEKGRFQGGERVQAKKIWTANKERGNREETGDGATGCSVKAFQFSDIGNTVFTGL